MVNIPHQNVIGNLMHVMVSTWLDIAYAISLVAQYLSNIGKKIACNWKNNKILETNYEQEVSVLKDQQTYSIIRLF